MARRRRDYRGQEMLFGTEGDASSVVEPPTSYLGQRRGIDDIPEISSQSLRPPVLSKPPRPVTSEARAIYEFLLRYAEDNPDVAASREGGNMLRRNCLIGAGYTHLRISGGRSISIEDASDARIHNVWTSICRSAHQYRKRINRT